MNKTKDTFLPDVIAIFSAMFVVVAAIALS